jgi:hypothetical protein
LGDGKGGMTIDLLRRMEGDMVCTEWDRWCWIEERELIELAGVYCVDDVFTLEGVEKLGAARNVFAVPGDRC